MIANSVRRVHILMSSRIESFTYEQESLCGADQNWHDVRMSTLSIHKTVVNRVVNQFCWRLPKSAELLFEQGILLALKGDRSQADQQLQGSQPAQAGNGTSRCLRWESRGWNPVMPRRRRFCLERRAARIRAIRTPITSTRCDRRPPVRSLLTTQWTEFFGSPKKSDQQRLGWG
jgi:hypothetical protein